MPYIAVNERDLSWYYRQRQAGQIVVLIPGVARFGPYEPIEVDESNFTEVLGDSSVDSADTSYNTAYSYIKSGADVLFWRVPLDGAQTASKEESGVTINAKYPGTMGNELKIRCIQSGVNYRFLVYHNTKGTWLESTFVNFTDPDSIYYYETTNQSLKYLNFEVTDPQNISIESNFVLTGGSDGTYDKDTVTDFLSSSDSNDIFNVLCDPLSHDFNVIVDGGYNNYTRYIEEISATVDDTGTVVTTYDLSNYLRLEDEPDPDDEEKMIPADEVTVYLDGEEIEDYSLVNENNVTTITITDGNLRNGSYIRIIEEFKDEQPRAMSQIDDKWVYLAETRGTSFYIVDGDRTWSAEEFFNYTDLPQANSKYVVASRCASGFNTSYATAFGPYISATYVSNGVTRILPGSYGFIVGWGNSLAQGNPMYYAPAGVKRASLNFVNNTSPYEVNSAILDLWQNQTSVTSDGHKVNPIMKLKQYGYVIYGNSTLLKNKADGSVSMLQMLSVRITANLIKEEAFRISLQLQFDQMSDGLFIEFSQLMGNYLNQLKYAGAVSDYQIICDKSNLTLDDLYSRTVPITIRISPIPAAENFDITLEITQAGVTFGTDDLQTNSMNDNGIYE